MSPNMTFCLALVLILVSSYPSVALSADEEIWEEIYNGTAEIDHENDDGGKTMPVKRTKVDKFGNFIEEVKHIGRDFSKMITPDIFSGDPIPKHCTTISPPPKLPMAKVASCNLLMGTPSGWEISKMDLCLNDLRVFIGGSKATESLSYDKVMKQMFSLSKEEQNFIGAVLTSYGEARASLGAEVLLVMQTLENRQKMAQDKCPNVTIMDIAFQPKQYSVWNRKDPNWSVAISTALDEPTEMDKLQDITKIYKKFRANDYSVASQDKQDFEKVTHFRSKKLTVSQGWGHEKHALQTMTVNKTQMGRSQKNADHLFFRDVGSSFKFHSHRPPQKGEDECYAK